jgi:hypothetical protein
MPQKVHVGSILTLEWSQMPGWKNEGFETEPYSGRWGVFKGLDGLALDRKIRAAGWNFFFIAAEVKVMFFGAIGAKNIQHAIKRLLQKVSEQHFNGLEVTGIVAKRFLGLPYTVVSAHSRHVQRGCYLDSVHIRQLSQEGVAATQS